MYERVPTKVLQTVIVVSSRTLLIPKSVSFASPKGELTSMLSGFTSLCICFLSSCKYYRPFKTYKNKIIFKSLSLIKLVIKSRCNNPDHKIKLDQDMRLLLIIFNCINLFSSLIGVKSKESSLNYFLEYSSSTLIGPTHLPWL